MRCYNPSNHLATAYNRTVAPIPLEPFMLPYHCVSSKEITIAELARGVTLDILRRETTWMNDRVLGLIAECTDADVVFSPVDPQAHDQYAQNPSAANEAWTLGHVVVHTTASSE